MMSQDKYYIPTIEEFYVGFEYERLVNNNWNKIITSVNFLSLEDIDEEIDKKEIRVKYLDKEDIESLGFEQQKLPYQFLHNTGIIRLVDLKHNKYSITHVADGCYLFYGEIKNKSELKRILQQIGYELSNMPIVQRNRI